MTENEREAYEERAAIMEYDGGLSRREAEREARQMIAEMRLQKQRQQHQGDNHNHHPTA